MGDSKVDPKTLKKTQETLGKHIKKPPLTDKLLSKPPFRFLHDLCTSVIKTTGFMKGLFTESEMNSENVKDRESKTAFLQKAIDLTALVNGKPVSAKPSKIVAGHEAEKTNEWLQALAEAISKKVDNDEYVKKVLTGDMTPPAEKAKSEKSEKPERKDREKSADRRKRPGVATKKESAPSKASMPSSKSRESIPARDGKLASKAYGLKKDSAKGNSSKRRVMDEDKDKDRERRHRRDGSARDKERHRSKEDERRERSDKREDRDKDRHRDKEDRDKDRQREKDRHRDKDERTERKQESRKDRDEHHRDKDRERRKHRGDEDGGGEESREKKSGSPREPETKQVTDLFALQAIAAEAGIVLSPILKDEPTPANLSARDQPIERTCYGVPTSNVVRSSVMIVKVERHIYPSKECATPAHRVPRPTSAKGSRRHQINGEEAAKQETTMNGHSDATEAPSQQQPRATTARLARPSSARPAPPRVKKNEPPPEEPAVIGPSNVPNIIRDQQDASDDDEDDMFETKDDEPAPPQPEPLVSETPDDGTEHGGLVKKMMEAKEKLEGGSHAPNQQPKKVEIDRSSQVSDATRKKERELVRREIEKLRGSIQTLTRSVNPLGKILDFVQEDLDSMQKELEMWKRENGQNQVALQREQSITESSIEPLRAHLTEIDNAINDQLDLIAAVKSNVLKNDERITKMLGSITKS